MTDPELRTAILDRLKVLYPEPWFHGWGINHPTSSEGAGLGWDATVFVYGMDDAFPVPEQDYYESLEALLAYLNSIEPPEVK